MLLKVDCIPNAGEKYICVTFDENDFGFAPIKCGVSQGSILGHLL